MGGDNSGNTEDSNQGKARGIFLIGKKRGRIHEEVKADIKQIIQRINLEKKHLEARKNMIEEYIMRKEKEKNMIEEDIVRKEKEKNIIEKEIRRKDEEEKNIKEKENKLLKIKEEIDVNELNYISELMEVVKMKKAIENQEEDKNVQ
jgi:hypothetical protein